MSETETFKLVLKEFFVKKFSYFLNQLKNKIHEISEKVTKFCIIEQNLSGFSTN